MRAKVGPYPRPWKRSFLLFPHLFGEYEDGGVWVWFEFVDIRKVDADTVEIRTWDGLQRKFSVSGE